MDDLREGILAEIRRILASELEHEGPVEPRHELLKDLLLDSVGAVVLAVGLEDRFRVILPADVVSAVVTVGDLVDAVAKASLEAGERGEKGAAAEGSGS